MPIFEYRCLSCGQLTEKIQRQSQAELTCPRCGDVAKRSISTPAAATVSKGSCTTPGASGFT